MTPRGRRFRCPRRRRIVRPPTTSGTRPPTSHRTATNDRHRRLGTSTLHGHRDRHGRDAARRRPRRPRRRARPRRLGRQAQRPPPPRAGNAPPRVTTCQLDAPGTYPFVCQIRPSMRRHRRRSAPQQLRGMPCAARLARCLPVTGSTDLASPSTSSPNRRRLGRNGQEAVSPASAAASEIQRSSGRQRDLLDQPQRGREEA